MIDVVILGALGAHICLFIYLLFIYLLSGNKAIFYLLSLQLELSN
jgi:hypothetical protein